MPKDTEEALRRLEQLLEEEEEEEYEEAEEDEEEAEAYEADESEEDEVVVLSGSGVRVYNADRTDVLTRNAASKSTAKHQPETSSAKRVSSLAA